MSMPATTKWVLLALVGLAIAIGVAIAGANLASRQIGIASESVSAGNALAPALQAPAGNQNQPPPDTTTPETTTTEESSPPEETTESDDSGGDDHGGEDHSGHGGGGDSDGDDD